MKKSSDNFNAITTISDYIYEGKNLLYSPLSLNFALAVVSEGASEEVKKDFENYFGMPFDEYIETYKQYIENSSEQVEIANGFWIKDKFTLRKDFKDIITQNFQAETGAYKFDNDFVEMVNQWCAEKTYDMIQNILDAPQECQECDSISVNALYFNGEWAQEYEEENILDFDFTLFDKKELNHCFLFSIENVYLENDKAKGFMKYYKGNRYAFIGILPKEKGPFNLSDLDIESLFESKSQEEVHVAIPEFEFENKHKLTDSIKEVGLSSILDLSKFPFPNIADQMPMEINQIFQKTKIKLNESGTVAAAVTYNCIEGCMADDSFEEPEEKIVFLDRPFAFLIYDTQENKTLFIGKVVNPAE